LLTRMRVTVSWVGGVVLPLAAFLPGMNQAVLAVVALTCCFFAELAERYSFFRAVVFPRMPGV
jgi:DMSO reductase anchor subunit